MKHALIALLLCAVGGCASPPDAYIGPVMVGCIQNEGPYSTQQLREPHVSLQVFSPFLVSPERLSVRDDMIALVRAGKLKGALALGATQIALKEVDAGEKDSVELAALITDVSELQQALQRMGPAEAGYLRAIAIYSDVQEKNPEMLRPTIDLAILYRGQGKLARALALQLEAYPTLLAWLGPEHPDVIESEGELAQLHLKLKQYGKAAVLFQARLDRAKLAGDKAAIAINLKALTKIRHARPRTHAAIVSSSL